MGRCLELATLGRYTARPNPMVGCVIVVEDKIIAEGYHHHAGGPHAEVEAINKVSDPELLKEASLYVSLEPCAHFGRTPPCSDLIIESQIPKVVVATRDINAQVNGKGIAKMRARGIEVIEDVLSEEARELNRMFFTSHGKKRPYISLKWAQSSDGFSDPLRAENQVGQIWISHPESQVFSHKLRASHDAILVGRKTVYVDNPSLDTRAFKGANPKRIIIDPKDSLDKESKVFRDHNFLRFTNRPSLSQDRKFDTLEKLVHVLHEEGIQSVLVEGGAYTQKEFLKLGLWDEAYIIKSENKIEKGLPAPKIQKPGRIQSLGRDRLIQIRNQ